MRVPVLCLLLALAVPASAQIYKYTDANGKTVFTNQPPSGVDAKPVELPPTNTVGAQQPGAPMGSGDGEQRQARYAILAITGLPDEEALRANDGNFDIEVAIQPQLAMGDRLQLREQGRQRVGRVLAVEQQPVVAGAGADLGGIGIGERLP